MGRSKKPEPVKPIAPEPAREPIRLTNLYDAGILKGTLDEFAREVILDYGHQEDVMINNVKIGLGIAAMAIAAFSHFGPGKFPANWWMVFGCVVSYILLTFVMNIYSWKMEGDAFLVTKPFRNGKGLRLSSRMGRFSNEYTLVLTGREDPDIEVMSTVRISSFFHEDGYLAESAWRAEVEKLWQAFEQKRGEKVAKKKD
ncbi:hypothetical protein VOLCADRAFT_105904 [Volvox carteri f. nagariensis]|uniref:Signal peptidase complex subunit 2 n=1 Tax=Volvox carteri f. nagariensis TaxID=3068 RepID=D8U488_VOLCA|nr:uncharacterized protein VOLCADRAFT_105904 [Volvox carteri f. nagariensis]EFJ45361.1 hypothetical protein VOLCADRAFT_105904 [Volvox carteri f. nagariensis]|eukprot:XP_002953388.1 hypothetical protein VOLCADRAFT_105904 [Volvox carteri f. nagariensis]